MTNQINFYLNDDKYKPVTPLPSLQQYDNYQIYSLYCVDTNVASTRTESITGGGTYTSSSNGSNQKNSFIAVQTYNVYSKIPCDFRSIIQTYP
jgi:hypothetical protein